MRIALTLEVYARGDRNEKKYLCFLITQTVGESGIQAAGA